MSSDNTVWGPVKFVQGSSTYYFPEATSEWNTNFKKLRTLAAEIENSDGAYDFLGSNPGFSPKGEVSVTFFLVASPTKSLETLKQELDLLIHKGKGQLYIRRLSLDNDLRWCHARIKHIDAPESADRYTQHYLEATVTFEAPEARWRVSPSTEGESLWGGGDLWGGSGVLWGGSAGTVYSGATPLDLSIDYVGTARTFPIVKIICGAGETVNNPKITRLENNVVVESVQFLGVVEASQTLLIDCEKKSLLLAGLSQFKNLAVTRGRWLSLMPGINAIRITSDSPTDAGHVKFRITEMYY